MSDKNQSWSRYHSAVRQDIKFTILGKENIEFDENGQATKINYMSGKTKAYWDNVFDQLAEYGMTKEEMIHYASEKSIIYKKIIGQYFSGEKEMPLSHHFHLLNRMGFNDKGEMIKPVFSSRMQLDRLFLTRTISPTFVLNINPDDWNDIKFDISGYFYQVSVKRFIDMCMTLTDWYFTKGNKDEDKKRRTKNPFTRYKMQILVKRAMYNAEIKVGRAAREFSKFQPKKRDE